MSESAPAGIAILPIRVPSDVAELRDGDFADFRAAIDVRNRIGVEQSGADAGWFAPEESLPLWLSTDEDVLGWIVREDEVVVGRAMLFVPHEQGSRRAQVHVQVLPEFRARGIGTRMLGFLELRAKERGRDVLQSWSEHTPNPGEQVSAATGFGSIPVDAATALLTRSGFTLEQVYRVSTLDLAACLSAVGPIRDAAIAASAGYRYVTWTTPTPAEWIDDYAWMKSRMSTDAPSGDTVMDEEAWDAARVRRLEKADLDSGATTLVGAALHVGSGRLVAFTELVRHDQEDAPIHQRDTLVLAEHRGHRLGALVKTETLLLARDRFPHGDRIVTGNAEENRPMLDINEAMGFTPTRYSGDWQKIAR